MSANISVGDIVRVTERPPYLKTAEPMPMLRSAELIQVGEEGRVLSRKPAGYFGIRFANGSFLVDGKYLELVQDES